MDFFSPIIQAIMSFLSNIFGGIFGGGNMQNPKPSEITGIPISGAQGAIAPQAQAAAIAPAAPPKPSAEEIMASWKQEMAASTIPQSVQNAIAMKEPQITEQLRAAKSPQEMQTIQMAAYAEATKPEWDKFVAKSKGEVSKLMDETIREVSQSGIPSKEKEEALKGLRTEKEARVKALVTKLDAKPLEEKISISLSKEKQESEKSELVSDTKNYTESVSKNVSEVSRENNGLAWTGSLLGWGSLALGVGGVIAAPFTAGQSLWVTAAACGMGVAGGACNYANGDTTKGVIEMASSAIPVGGIALKGAGLVGKATTMATNTKGFGATLEWAWAGIKSLAPWGDEARTVISNSNLTNGQMLRAVELAERTPALSKKGVLEAIGNGRIEVENTVLDFIKTGTKPATTLADANAQKWVEAAIKEYKWHDPIVGKSTNAWRAASTGFTLNAGNIVPTSTPQILPADGLAKQQSRES